jgi:Prion-inhibition and propagation
MVFLGNDVTATASLCFGVFRVCVEALQFIRRKVGTTEKVATKFHWEQYRLLIFGQRSGLFEKPNAKLNWHLILPYLGQIESILTSPEKLRETYHVEVGDEETIPLEMLLGTQDPESNIEKAMLDIIPNYLFFKAKSIRENKSVVKKLKWRVDSRDTFRRIANDISEINDQLENILPTADREWLHCTHNAVLRDLIARCVDDTGEALQLLNSTTDAYHTELQAAVQLKLVRLSIRPQRLVHNGNSDQNGIQPLKKLSKQRMKPLSSNHSLKYEGVELARYKGKLILLEWRQAGAAHWQQVQIEIQSLAVHLREMGPPSFHSLPCLGFALSEETEKCGIGYDVMAADNLVGIENFKMVSLKDVLNNPSAAGRVSLNTRLRIAKDLAETVLQNHTAGFSHNDIRSEHILFLVIYDDYIKYIPKATTTLLGYAPAQRVLSSELINGENTDRYGKTDMAGNNRIHGEGRSTHVQDSDLYCLGCVLLELALWKPLDLICREISSGKSQSSIETVDLKGKSKIIPEGLEIRWGDVNRLTEHAVQESLGDKLFHAAGEKFTEAVIMCFRLNTEAKMSEFTLEKQRKIYEILSSVSL